MDMIDILPHHANRYFEEFYLEGDVSKSILWYDKKMKVHGINAVKNVVSNPEQLIRVVDSYDSWCEMCPRNLFSSNYDFNKECMCDRHLKLVSDWDFAVTLGIDCVLDKDPIKSKEFFELMRPTFDKLVSEPIIINFNENKPLHQQFIIPKKFELESFVNLICNKKKF